MKKVFKYILIITLIFTAINIYIFNYNIVKADEEDDDLDSSYVDDDSDFDEDDFFEDDEEADDFYDDEEEEDVDDNFFDDIDNQGNGEIQQGQGTNIGQSLYQGQGQTYQASEQAAEGTDTNSKNILPHAGSEEILLSLIILLLVLARILYKKYNNLKLE